MSETDILKIAREVLDIEIQGLSSVRERLNHSFALAVELMESCTGRIVLTGLGKSGLVARKIAATLSSTGTPAFFLHPVEGAHGDMGMIRAEDVVVAISNSGETDELNALIPTLRSLGPKIVALTGGIDSTLSRIAHITIDCRVPKEACPLDLAPTASTTAALAVGDALAVCLMRKSCFNEKDFQRYHPGGALGQRLNIHVQELMHTAPACVGVNALVCEALSALHDGGLGAVLIQESSGRLQGILTDGDLRRLLVSGSYDPDALVTEVMTHSPSFARPMDSVAQTLDIMEHKAITVLPVVEDDVVVGVIHLHDLLGKGRIRFSG